MYAEYMKYTHCVSNSNRTPVMAVILCKTACLSMWECGRFVIMSMCLCVGVHVSESMFCH